MGHQEPRYGREPAGDELGGDDRGRYAPGWYDQQSTPYGVEAPYSGYGQPPSPYGAAQPGGYGPAPAYGTPAPPTRRRVPLVAAIIGAVVVFAGAGFGVWYLVAGPGRSNSGHAAPPPVVAPPTRPSAPLGASQSGSRAPNGGGAAAYDVGSCFAEQPGSTRGKVQLTPVACAGAQAVFVINKVGVNPADCQASGDFQKHGYVVPDETADVVYCVSLVVPADACLSLGGTAPIARATCGSSPDVVQVLAIEAAPNAGTACQDKVNPDVWFYQSPTSGQFECLSRPLPSASTTASAPPTS